MLDSKKIPEKKLESILAGDTKPKLAEIISNLSNDIKEKCFLSLIAIILLLIIMTKTGTLNVAAYWIIIGTIILSVCFIVNLEGRKYLTKRNETLYVLNNLKNGKYDALFEKHGKEISSTDEKNCTKTTQEETINNNQ